MDCVFLDCPAATSGRGHPVANDIIGQHPGFMFGLVLVLVPLAIGYVWYRRGLRPKTLDYEVLVSTSLLATASSRVKQELAVSWRGEPVNEPKLIEVLLENTGREAIVRADYDVPITLSISDGRLLEATVRSSSPVQAAKTDDLAVGPNEMTVEISPKLLNAGDSFIVQLVVDGFRAEVDVTSRFTGQDRAMKASGLVRPRDAPDWQGWTVLWIGFLTFLGSSFFGPAPTQDISGSTPTAVVIFLRLLVGFVFAMLVGLISWNVLGAPRRVAAAWRQGKRKAKQ